jgi:hypothetical protein
VRGASRSWRSLDLGSSALHLPGVGYSPDRRACDIASDVLCRDPRRVRHRCRTPFASNRQAPSSAAVSSKTTASRGPGRLPSSSAPSPCRTRRLHACTWDHEEPATDSLPAWLVAFATANRLPAPLRSLSTGLSARARQARPAAFRPWTRRPSDDFCNRHNLRARPRDRLNPESWRGKPSPRALARSADPTRLTEHGQRHPLRVRSRSPVSLAGQLLAEFRRSGAARSHLGWLRATNTRRGFRRGAPPRPRSAALPFRACLGAGERALPDPFRSDTSRRETQARSTGNRRCLDPTRAASIVLPRRTAKHAAPEVPSVGEVIHRLLPSCG